MCSHLASHFAWFGLPPFIAIVLTTVAAHPAGAGPVTINGQTRSIHIAIPSIDPAESDVDDTTRAHNFDVALAGPGGTVESFDKSNFEGNDDGAIITPLFSHPGTLAPGLYTLSGASGARGRINPDEIQASYLIDFTASNAAIPLPAAAMPATILLAGLGAVVARHRWSARLPSRNA
jgi:hypothetical protein